VTLRLGNNKAGGKMLVRKLNEYDIDAHFKTVEHEHTDRHGTKAKIRERVIYIAPGADVLEKIDTLLNAEVQITQQPDNDAQAGHTALDIRIRQRQRQRDQSHEDRLRGEKGQGGEVSR